MATMITTDGIRTTVRPVKDGGFTLEELRGYVGGPLEIKELTAGFYMVSLRNAREIGAEVNPVAGLGYEIHMIHSKSDGSPALCDEPPAFYGICVFCSAEELGGTAPAYTETGDI